MVFNWLVLLLLIFQFETNDSSSNGYIKRDYNQHGCGMLGRSINVYNFYCRGNENSNILSDGIYRPQVFRPTVNSPYRPLLNLLFPVRRFKPISYADAIQPIRQQLPFQYQDQGSSVIHLSGAAAMVHDVTAQNAYRPQNIGYRPQITYMNSVNDNVYNPFKPESSTNVKPTPPPFQNKPHQNNRPTYSPLTPSPLTVDYFGTPIPTYPPTTTRPNYAVPAYSINLSTPRPLSPSSISNSFVNGAETPQMGASFVGNRPEISQITSSSSHNSDNRPGIINVSNTNQYGASQISNPINDHRPVTEVHHTDIDPPIFKPFGSDLIGGVSSSVNGFLPNFNGQTLIPGRSFLRSFLNLF